MPRLEKRRVGLSAASRLPDYHQEDGMPLLSLTRASRSKQGTKIEEKPFSGKENANTVKMAIFGSGRQELKDSVMSKK
ncbi:hypothetical protein [Algoriphagus sp.]|uniref:hypothetical protein n=1 Tax=Algoriphagus sp. TaxID=1872435 RepID=UPI00273632BD|nr:hypothetical protein [Algoriphagus sp.]